MMGKDPFDIFRENSERELDLQPQQATWTQIANRLDGDKGRKKAGWFMFLPWIAVLGLGALCGTLLFQQSEMRSDLLDLQTQLETRSQAEGTQIDTLIIYNTITHVDTVYSIQRIYTPNLATQWQHAFTAALASKDISRHNINGANPNFRIIGGMSLLQKDPSEENDQRDLDSIRLSQKAPLSLDLNEEFMQDSPLDRRDTSDRMKDKGTSTDAVAQDPIIKEAQESTLKMDRIMTKVPIDSIIVKEEVKKKERIPLKERLIGFDRYVGLYGGTAVLANQQDVKNGSWTVGTAIHRQVSDNIWFGLNADFSLWHIETNHVNEVAWIPNEPSSDPNFVVDLVEARMPTIGASVALQYRFLPERSLSPFVELGYGARYMLWPNVRYELKNDLGNNDLIIESELRKDEFVINDLMPALGLNFWIDPNYSLTIWTGYRFNTSKRAYVEPDHLKLRLGLFRRF